MNRNTHRIARASLRVLLLAGCIHGACPLEAAENPKPNIILVMPGERLLCVGCHESQNKVPLPRSATAMIRQPSEIRSFCGPARSSSSTSRSAGNRTCS